MQNAKKISKIMSDDRAPWLLPHKGWVKGPTPRPGFSSALMIISSQPVACSATRHPPSLSSPFACASQLQHSTVSFCRAAKHSVYHRLSDASCAPVLPGRKQSHAISSSFIKAPRQKCKASNWAPVPQLRSANLSAILNIFYKPVDLCRQTFSPLSRLN